MAADADTANRKLSQNAAMQMSPPSLSPPDKGAVKSALDAEKFMTAARLEVAETEDDCATADDEVADDFKDAARVDTSQMRVALVSGTIVALVLTALVGWLGLAAYQSHSAQQLRELFIQAGRQGALNLTTIDWQHADSDVQRIVDSATGTFGSGRRNWYSGICSSLRRCKLPSHCPRRYSGRPHGAHWPGPERVKPALVAMIRCSS